MPPTRMSRAEKQAATRQQLLEAAERIARRDGFANLSVARVAEEAGLTTGAIYSAFGSKQQLVLEAAEALTEGLLIDLSTMTSLDLRQLLAHMAAQLNETSRKRSKAAVLAFEFVTVALRDAKLRQAMLGEIAEAAGDSAFDAWAEAHKDELPVPGGQLLEVVNALAWGFMLRRLLLGTEAVPDDLVAWTFSRLAPDKPSSA
jgi:AcrR family transcriptional regulator